MEIRAIDRILARLDQTKLAVDLTTLANHWLGHVWSATILAHAVRCLEVYLGHSSRLAARTRVLQVLYSGLGGHGNVAFSLSRAAELAGAWESSMLFVGVEPLLPEYARACRIAGIDLESVRTIRQRGWAAWPLIYRKLSKLAPDAIILHSVKSILPCALYARLHRIPLLAVEHQANSLKSSKEWWISRVLMRHADAIVVLTPEYRLELQRRLSANWRESKVHVISNGVDTNAYHPDRTKPSRGPFRVIGMASRMTGIKRQDVLVDAMALLCAQDGHDAWRLTLAGEGDSLEELRARALALQLEDVVSFVGNLGERALLDWFGSLDIYAHASSGETLSTSLLQALAMGLPVIGSDVAGINSLLGLGGGVGLPVSQTPEAFAKGIRQLVDDTDLTSGLRTRARALAVAEYGQPAMFEKYQRILERLCTG